MSLLASTMALPFSDHPDDMPPGLADPKTFAAPFPVPPPAPDPEPPLHRVSLRGRGPLRPGRRGENEESPRLGTGFRG